MKNLNEYKVSKNIINKTIKELAFNITKSYFLRDKNTPMDFSMYYILDNNSLHMKYYEVKNIFKRGKDLEIEFKCIREQEILGQFIHQETFGNKLEINICLLNDLYKTENKRSIQIMFFKVIFHELVHYFDRLNNTIKSDNKYIENLTNLSQEDSSFIRKIAPFINKDTVYFLSDTEIRAFAVSYYLFGRLKKDYKQTDTYEVYEILKEKLTNNLNLLYNNINKVVESNQVTKEFITKIKTTVFNIKSTKIDNIFDKLYYFTELQDKEQISFFLKKLFNIYWNKFKIQLTKAEFTFEEYYKMGINNEKFK